MTEIEIPDPEPQHAGASSPAPAGPYRNLLVPLVVVPALIIMVLVLVFTLFGAIAGDEDSPRDNLEDLLHGGFNERQQAAFGLVRQILEVPRARSEGREPEWGIDESFLPQLRAARETLGAIHDPGDVRYAFVLSGLMAHLGDPEGVHQLIEVTRLSDALDPDGDFRVNATFTLGAIGRELAEPERLAAARALIALLDAPDQGLVLAAAAALQNLPAPDTVPALLGVLASRRADQRLQAALSLVRLGDVGGADVLREMVHREPYRAEHAEAPARWPARLMAESRRKAVEGLLALGQPPERTQLERWAEEDPDPGMREIARRLLADG